MTSSGTPARVLVVEDEPAIRESVVDALADAGFRASGRPDGADLEGVLAGLRPDLVVLDVMLPGFDGLEVCRRIQADRPVPVLMLTARDDETDLLVGLAVGADDYLTKPFSPRELAARVHALFRRIDRTTAAPARIVLGDLEIDPAQRRVSRGGEPAHLTPTEFDLLAHLAARPRHVHARDALVTAVWGWADGTANRAVDSHVKALRRKLGADLIRTVHGVGYALEVPPS